MDGMWISAVLTPVCCAVARSSCEDPPEGRQRWTLKLLADKLVELEVVDSISHEAVRQTLKKTQSNPGAKNSGA